MCTSLQVYQNFSLPDEVLLPTNTEVLFCKVSFLKHKKRSSNKFGESVWHIKTVIQFSMISIKPFIFLWPTGKDFGILFIRVKTKTVQIVFLLLDSLRRFRPNYLKVLSCFSDPTISYFICVMLKIFLKSLNLW